MPSGESNDHGVTVATLASSETSTRDMNANSQSESALLPKLPGTALPHALLNIRAAATVDAFTAAAAAHQQRRLPPNATGFNDTKKRAANTSRLVTVCAVHHRAKKRCPVDWYVKKTLTRLLLRCNTTPQTQSKTR
jgi:hypothetical protein